MDSLHPTQKGLCNLPGDSEKVIDADEEVFILYTELQAQDYQSLPSSTMTSFRGLGHVDSHQDIVFLKFPLINPVAGSSSASAASNTSSELESSKSRRRARKKRDTHRPDVIELEIQIAQDKTSLRSRKGDTGSVVWRASVDLASAILQDAHFPPSIHPSLLDLSKLRNAHVLELGSGTGILGVALSPFVHRYTCTDVHDLMPLIHKNLVLNFPEWPHECNISLTALDWTELHRTSLSNRSRFFKFDPVDLLLIVDCIYHPSLIPPLLATIDYMTIPDVTTVLVVVELRAEDVIREFLSCWLNVPAWEIWRIGNGERDIMKRPYAIWVGIKHRSETS
ncbi:putative methyltransferase-domain-containing protein [Lentinula guzmanii]|uniref:Methyltransferase-domain-containing protein n=2 Tax=Lentinula TaxID=5352 RepID=A0AA38JG80_9AGAR|nr:putative methyltransferase-domain-containing protein [Lentinula guzmanii]KAJ3789820.1 putative methyltransferase-domain-containing protein [Lentinula aff. detonsa]